MGRFTLMSPTNPIAIHPEYIAQENTTLHINQHSASWSSGDFTVSTTTHSPTNPSSSTKLFTITGDTISWRQRRHIHDASGKTICDLYRKSTGCTWYAQSPSPPSSPHSASSEEDKTPPKAVMAPRWSTLKDKMDVYVKNAADGEEGKGREVVMEVRGQDVWKLRTNVYADGKLVMSLKRGNRYAIYIPGKNPEWVVDVAERVDLSIAPMIVVVMAYNMYNSSPQSSFSGNGGDRAG